MDNSGQDSRTDEAQRHVDDADRANGEPLATDDAVARPATVPPGQDTATGTDPDAKYDQPGYEDKSFGQAVNQDQELVEQLLDETGDESAAEERFEQESAGAPALQRQHDDSKN